MQVLTTTDRNIAQRTAAASGAFVMCPSILVAGVGAGAPEMYSRAYELAVKSVSRRFQARYAEPSLN